MKKVIAGALYYGIVSMAVAFLIWLFIAGWPEVEGAVGVCAAVVGLAYLVFWSHHNK